LKIAYFDCFSGISGDMILGALVDAGLDEGALRTELSKLKLNEYSLNFTKSIKHGITGTKANVKLLHELESDISKDASDETENQRMRQWSEATSAQSHPENQNRESGFEAERSEHNHEHHNQHTQSEHHHKKPQEPSRFIGDIFKIIDESDLEGQVKDTAKEIFDRLATAEAKIHNATKDTVHLHEVSAIDSIVDIVGTVIGINLMGIEEIYASPIHLGGGFIKCSHGVMPVPVPGTLELLRGVPVRQTSIRKELVTPTGAAIITTLAKGFGAIPEMTIEKNGYGAGSRDLEEQPNLLRIIIGEKKNSIMKIR